MASKKSVRKASTKKTLKIKTASKKKAVAKKNKAPSVSKTTNTKRKGKLGSRTKDTGTAKKPKKVTKTLAKRKASAKGTSGQKKAVAKKTTGAPNKTVMQSVSKPKSSKTAKKKPLVQKRKTSIAKKTIKSSEAKKPASKSAESSAQTAQSVLKGKESPLSSTERYNIGGLFACAIERQHDPNFSRLRSVLRHLDLSSQEKDNLIRLSEGFMIPKLFAENLEEQKVNQLLADLVKFSTAEGGYEKYWREEIQQIGFWLGVFPAQFQAIEQQAKR